MKQQLWISDVTEMNEGRVCVAGIAPNGECIRPIIRGENPAASWLTQGGTETVGAFSNIEVDLIRHIPTRPHTEDWEIAESFTCWSTVVEPTERESLLGRILVPQIEDIFGAEIHFSESDNLRSGSWIRLGQGVRSLGTVGPIRVWDVAMDHDRHGRVRTRVTFNDSSNVGYRLTITDLAFRRSVATLLSQQVPDLPRVRSMIRSHISKSKCYIRVGLARPWNSSGRDMIECYLQATGIYTFPEPIDQFLSAAAR